MEKLLLLLLLPVHAFAITIIPTFTDGGGMVWDSTQRNVVNFAANIWSGVFVDPYVFTIDFELYDAGPGTWSGLSSVDFPLETGTTVFPWSSGVMHKIYINTQYLAVNDFPLWFDPSPESSDDIPLDVFDGVSLILHEICHSLGFGAPFMQDVNLPTMAFLWDINIINHVFDPGGLNVAMDPYSEDEHLAEIGVFMNSGIHISERIGVSPTVVSMLSKAYGYTPVPEPSTVGMIGLALFLFMLKRPSVR